MHHNHGHTQDASGVGGVDDGATLGNVTPIDV
jgi:hypothetical protein